MERRRLCRFEMDHYMSARFQPCTASYKYIQPELVTTHGKFFEGVKVLKMPSIRRFAMDDAAEDADAMVYLCCVLLNVSVTDRI